MSQVASGRISGATGFQFLKSMLQVAFAGFFDFGCRTCRNLGLQVAKFKNSFRFSLYVFQNFRQAAGFLVFFFLAQRHLSTI